MIKRVRDLLGKSNKPETEPGPEPAPPSTSDWTPSDEYFEQLDKAFADFEGTRAGAQSAVDAEPAAAPEPGAMSNGRVMPDVADAFEAILAAEETGEEFIPAAINLPDYVIDRIAARVADKLRSGALKADVTRVLNEVAERLMREEIARIRAKIESQPGKSS